MITDQQKRAESLVAFEHGGAAEVQFIASTSEGKRCQTIDALIHQHIMRQTILTQEEMEMIARGDWRTMPALNYFLYRGCEFIAVRNAEGAALTFIQVFPRYSADAAVMWRAVTMMRGGGYLLSLVDFIDYWLVSWTLYSSAGREMWQVSDPDECVAVCLAMLKAKGVSIEGLEGLGYG